MMHNNLYNIGCILYLYNYVRRCGKFQYYDHTIAIAFVSARVSLCDVTIPSN